MGGAVDAGAVNMIAGTDGGLAPGALYLQGRPERGDRFGSALIVHDFLGDAGADLVVGAPGETVAGIAGAGAVSLFDGTATATGPERLLHGGLTNSPPVEPGDASGASLGWYTVHPSGVLMTLVVGAPGRNRFGAPGETVGGARGAGAASIVYGHRYFVNQILLYQGHGGIGGTPEAGDAFGAAVA